MYTVRFAIEVATVNQFVVVQKVSVVHHVIEFSNAIQKHVWTEAYAKQARMVIRNVIVHQGEFKLIFRVKNDKINI